MELNKFMELEPRVVAQHSTGMAPSEIDAKLGLEPVTAHDVMCLHWRNGKLSALRCAND